MLFMSYLVRRAPVLEDVPHDSVVAEPREEVEDGVACRQLAALGEAADGEDVSVEAPCVALVASVLADAGDDSQVDLPLSWACGAAPMTPCA